MTAPVKDAFWITRNPVGWLRESRSAARSEAPRPPGPRGRPFIGVLPELKADPFRYLQHLANVYGDVFRVPLPLYDVVVVNHPDHVRHIMNNRDGEYSLIGSAGWIRRVVGAPMAMLEGDEFRQRRKVLSPVFSRGHITQIATMMTDEFADRLARWDRFADTGERIDLQRELADVVFPAFMRAMFTMRLPDDELHRLAADVRTVLRSTPSPLFFLAPAPKLLPGEGNAVQAFRRMKQWVTRAVDRRLTDRKPYHDLMQVVLDGRYDDGTAISRRDTIAELTILIGAGYENVVAALSWTLALLPQNPEAQQRLYDEIDGLGGAVPNYDDLDRLPWAKACFDEGQRLQATLFHPRFAMIDDTIGGYRIRRGTLVGTAPYALQRDRRWWGPDPDSYEPMRFYDNAVVAKRPSLAFIPFGAGPHRCFGATLAYMDAQFVLALLHQRFRIHIPSGWVARHDPDLPWPVKGGVPAMLSKVSAPALRS